MATLKDLEQDLYRRLGFATGTPDTATQTRLRSYLNETQQEILSERGMESLLNDRVTFASVASTPEYSLPQVVAGIKQIRETTNDRRLVPLAFDEYIARFPDPTQSTGTPDRYVDLGFAAVSVQPSDASELFFKSDSASDDNTKKVFIEGYTTGGNFRAAAVAMNGVTAVSLGATITSWIQVTKFYIGLASGATTATTAAGNITLHEDAGSGTELARIPIGQSHARYRRIALAICPSAAVTYTVEFERDVQAMSNPQDESVLPPRFHRLLAIGARMKEYEKQDDERRYVLAAREMANELRKLKHFVYGSPSLNLRGASGTGRSTLGANYPAGI